MTPPEDLSIATRETRRSLWVRGPKRVRRTNRCQRDAARIAVRLVASKDFGGAKTALAELTAIAAFVSTNPLRAAASVAAGMVDLGSSDPNTARRHLEDAVDSYLESANLLESLPQGEATSRKNRSENDAGLTKREVEVRKLVADRLNNQVIADTLFVSEHTIHRDVANILSKLSVSSRAVGVAQATRCGLI